jgi:hypothetical protein
MLSSSLFIAFKKRERLSLLWIMSIIILIPGCASIFGSTHGTVSIRSEPSAADIIIRDNYGKEVFQGTTPADISLPKKVGFFHGADYLVTISKNGCEPRSITVTRSISGWYWGNIILGGLIGMLIIDPATGAMWTLQKDLPIVRLPCTSGEFNQMQENLVHLLIISIDQLPLTTKTLLIPLEVDYDKTHYRNP